MKLTTYWVMAILSVLIFLYACNRGPREYNSESFVPDKRLPPPSPLTPIKAKQDTLKEVETVAVDSFSAPPKQKSYFRPGTFEMGYIYDIRANSTISHQSGVNKYSVKIVMLENGSFHVVSPKDTPGKHNLLRAPVGQNMTILKPTTFYKYDVFYEQPHSMSFGQTVWVPATLYYIDGSLKAVRVDKHIYASNQVNLQIVKQNDVYQPSEHTEMEQRVHTVVKGESLMRIARKYNTTVEDLKELNNLKTNLIYPGQKLKYAK
jgi:LysM repeat protein